MDPTGWLTDWLLYLIPASALIGAIAATCVVAVCVRNLLALASADGPAGRRDEPTP